jgi:hypothetical protein
MFEPFDINEIQINKGGGYNYYNTIKSNVYEVNPYKNTINTNYNNYYMDNDYSNMDRGDKSNRNKITFSSNKKEKIQFIPMEVKKKTNIHSVEKSNNSKQIKMNKKNYNMANSKNKKYKEVDDNNIYINEQIQLYNKKNYNMNNNNYKRNDNELNKYKKTRNSSSIDKQLSGYSGY